MAREALFQYKVDKYLNNRENGFYLRLIGSPSYICYILKRYIVLHPDKEEEINKIINNIDEIYYSKLTKEQLGVIMKKVMNEKNTSYSKILFDLLFSDEKMLDKIIKENEITTSKFNSIMKKFKRYYPNQDDEVRYLYDIYDKYIKKETLNNIDDIDYINKTDNLTEQELNLIDIYKSNYCIIEYCSQEELSYSVASFIVDKYKKSKNTVLSQMANDILSRDSSDIKEKLKNFANYIALNEDFDILDYLDITKLSFVDFKRIIAPLVPRKVSDIVINRLRRLNALNNNISKNIELDSKSIIGGREILREEKEKIFEYIENKNYPIGVYQFVLRKYANGNLDIDNVLVKK
ncbi:MAG: hypothetical protein J6G98_04625 [Bacilli bacterium]|nr:hypothetical protein [Bacilli bacterium]